MRNLPIVLFVVFCVIRSINGNIIPDDAEDTLQDHINHLSGLMEKFGALYLTSLDQKLTAIISALTAVDTNIKSLQEKSGTWNIFLHHVQAWTDTMKAIDHKVDLVRLAQDDNHSLENQLNRMEFAINHISTKIDTLNEKTQAINSPMLEKIKDIHEIVKSREKSDRVEKDGLSAKLSAIMRHVLMIEGSQGRESRRTKVSRGAARDVDYYNQNLESIELKIDQILNEFPATNNMDEVIATQRKQSDLIKNMQELIRAIDERTVRIYDAEAQHSTKLLSCCRQSNDELATFTTSSDLLLKRIEKLVLDVQNQVKGLPQEDSGKESKGTKTNSKVGGTGGHIGPVGKNREANTTGHEKSTTDSKPSVDTDDSKIDDKKPVDKKKDKTEEEKERQSPKISTDVSSEDDENDEEIDDIRQGVIDSPQKTGCHEIEERVDGVYKFKNTSHDDIRNYHERYCAFPTDGAGWTVIQRRGPFEVQENFNRSWDDYKYGFGDLHRDFWFGNEFIHRMVYKEIHELRIEMEDFDGVQVWAEYSTFQIEPEKDNYKLIIGGFRGSVTDSMLYHDGMEFSTYDRRNDRTVEECCSCATGYGSGWWFDNCSEANLNGVYRDQPKDHDYIGIVWENWHGDYSLKKSRMLIRPKNIWQDLEDSEADLFPEIPPEDP